MQIFQDIFAPLEMESSDNYMAISPVEDTQATPVQQQSEEGEFLGPSGEEEIRVGSKKRGRPKKYDISCVPNVTVTNSKPGEKRGRGRPRGSHYRQMHSVIGGHVLAPCSYDRNFTPVVLSVPRGEDIVEKVMAFFQKGVQVICILTASGPVSVVDLRPGRSGANVIRYEGFFEILTLVGSRMFVDVGGEHRGPLMLSTTLAFSDGRVFGGAIGGCLIAAAPVQVVIGIIKQEGAKKLSNKKRLFEPSIPQPMTGNMDITIASLPVDTTPEKSVMTPRGSLMSPAHEDHDNIKADLTEDHHVQNGSQPLDQSDDNNGDAQNALQPSDHVPGQISSDDDDGAHEG